MGGGGIDLEFPFKEMQGQRKQSADNLLSSAGLAGGGRWGRANGVCSIWSHRSSFSFLISWALSLQTDEGGREGSLRRGGGGRDEREFEEPGLVIAAAA